MSDRRSVHVLENARFAGAAPLFGLVIGGVGVVSNSIRHDGDLRAGVMPWTMTIALISLAWCAYGILVTHQPGASLVLRIGATWTALAFLGMASFFLAIAVGSALGIEEEDAGLAALPPLAGMMLGILSIAPASATLAFGLNRSGQLPRWTRSAMWASAPILPLMLIYGGFVDGKGETVGLFVLMAGFAAIWIAVGLAISSAAAAVAEPSASAG